MKAIDRKFKRRCVSCGSYKPKSELLRISFVQPAFSGLESQGFSLCEGSLVEQSAQAFVGRSAYTCLTTACRHQAVQQGGKRLAGALRRRPSASLLEQISPLNSH
jgi:predicted RNA-binding protein YlxR (DUF448 family)